MVSDWLRRGKPPSSKRAKGSDGYCEFNVGEVLAMAMGAASGWVLTELEDGRDAPHATNIADIKPDEPDGIVTLISLDMDAYAEKYGKKSVRKNVTIPAWLDTFGEQHGINYSQVLRQGLEERYRDLQNA